MNTTALPGGTQHLADGLLEAVVRVRDHQLDAAQATPEQTLEEGGPERLCLGRAQPQADNLPPALSADRYCDYGRHGDDPATLAYLEVGGVQPEIGPLAFQRAIQEAVHPLIDVLAELGDRALADPREAHCLDQIVHPPGRHPADP